MNKSLTLTQKSDKELSKLQKQFNSYVKKIQDLKAEKERVAKQLEEIQVKVSGELVPLERKQIDLRVAFVKLVDSKYEDKFFKKKEKEKMQDFIVSQCHQLIDEYGKEELKEMFERHSLGSSYEETNNQANETVSEAMKNMMSSMFGVEFDDDADVSTPEKMQAYINEKMLEKEAEQEAKKANRKKTEKQVVKEEKIKLEALNINKTARAIYTDLVKQFHPDRERDEAEKVRKTEIMHQITEAYEQNDLYKLLQLKLELQATSPDALNLADDQLKYYNKMLKEQVQELDEALYQMKGGYGSMYNRLGGDERTMKAKFITETKRLKKIIKALENDLKLVADQEYMRAFFRGYQISGRGDLDIFDLMRF